MHALYGLAAALSLGAAATAGGATQPASSEPGTSEPFREFETLIEAVDAICMPYLLKGNLDIADSLQTMTAAQVEELSGTWKDLHAAYAFSIAGDAYFWPIQYDGLCRITGFRAVDPDVLKAQWDAYMAGPGDGFRSSGFSARTTDTSRRAGGRASKPVASGFLEFSVSQAVSNDRAVVDATVILFGEPTPAQCDDWPEHCSEE